MEEYVLKTENNDNLERLSQLSNGNWIIYKWMSLPNLILRDKNGKETVKLEECYSDIRIWWDDSGPKIYVITYAHSVTSISASTDVFWLKLKWLNQGGGVEKVEEILDHVICRDSKRRTSWSFSISNEQAENIKRVAVDPFGTPNWNSCN